MKTLSVVFLCGDKSPYGIAHLGSITKNFNVKAIIIADENRWYTFRHSLAGGEQYCSNRSLKNKAIDLYRLIKKSIPFLKKNKPNDPLEDYKIPIIKLNDVNSKNSLHLIKQYSPELLLSAAYPQIFSEELIKVSPRGAINFHPSLLPRCRGAHPHYWCLATGEKKGGISAHFMTKNIDDGDIISQHSFDISTMYYADLYEKIMHITPTLVKDVALFLNNPNSKPTPQDKNHVTIFRNDRAIHRKLDFSNMNAHELFNKIRAGKAYSFHKNKHFFVTEADVFEKNRHMTNNITVAPGTIIDISSIGVVIYTVDQLFIAIKRIKLGNKVQSYSVWVDKYHISIGEKLI